MGLHQEISVFVIKLKLLLLQKTGALVISTICMLTEIFMFPNTRNIHPLLERKYYLLCAMFFFTGTSFLSGALFTTSKTTKINNKDVLFPTSRGVSVGRLYCLCSLTFIKVSATKVRASPSLI